MSNLLLLQDQFQKHLLRGQTKFQKQIISTEKVSAATRLAIYRNAYRSRLIEALASNFPILYAYAGTEIFTVIAGNYIDKYPSPYRSLRWFGDNLAIFLKRHHEYKQFPYLTELAQFEWAMTLVFDAADSAVISVDTIANIPPEAWAKMRLSIHPSVQRCNFKWNVVSIWQAIIDDQTPDEPIQNSSSVSWLIWRRDLLNRFYSMSADEAWAIDAVIQGKTFGELCAGLCKWHPEANVGIQAAGLLKRWVEAGMITAVK